MFISPASLQNWCLDYICDHLSDLSSTTSTSSSSSSSSSSSWTELSGPQKETRLRFRDPEVYFHSELSERLLKALCKKGKLNDCTLTLFDVGTTRLRRVSIPNASELSKEGLRVLKGHKITHLEICGLKFSVNDLVACLGEWTLHNLRSLNVARSTFSEGKRHCLVIALSKLKSLQSLDVSGTEFNRHALDIVVEDLPRLESLDISSTRVDDISPLRKCKHRLKHLAMYNLKYIKVSSCEDVLLELRELRTLDISEEKDNYTFEMFVPGVTRITDFLNSSESFPYLTSLDISGKGEIGRQELRSFLQRHRQLTYLGLIHSEVSAEECLTNPKDVDYNPNLQVGGVATEEQILLALKRYANRTSYVQKCLYNLFRLTPTFTEPRVDVIELVLTGMELHPQAFSVQMAATACLYNLTKGELATKTHPQVLARVVALCLVAMENFPNHYQLQKNILLTLCSDRILQDVPIDKFVCAKLVLDSLCAFEDPSMNRMSVAICSILAAKISTRETSLLGSRRHYMKKLLRLVKGKKDARNVDITMKFTLSALWNLTDESPTTCSVFLEEGGLLLFLEVLKTFPGEANVETKVLGLVNNIAEVPDLRRWLLKPNFIAILRKLLHSNQIDVSYFAAGIMAHLAAEGPAAWEDCEVSRDLILQELGDVVVAWDPPEGEMVAYRSFYPFISLLACNDAPQVQLWAVWAIHHVCTKNPQRYCPMLEAEEGSAMLNSMWADVTLDVRVREICGDIKQLLG
ncbi:hypothetical protein AAG570_004712 [Ranatra chinensis]|uniref:Uncharacterized protein n=1 Tax=Ranatra chinensis TaxID=642074 RepID=A0ABD0Y1M8_9HEMI